MALGPRVFINVQVVAKTKRNLMFVKSFTMKSNRYVFSNRKFKELYTLKTDLFTS